MRRSIVSAHCDRSSVEARDCGSIGSGDRFWLEEGALVDRLQRLEPS